VQLLTNDTAISAVKWPDCTSRPTACTRSH